MLTSGEDDRFRSDVVHDGTMRLLVVADGFEPPPVDDIRVQGPAHDLGELRLRPGLVLEGRVVDERGVGVAEPELRQLRGASADT